MGALVGERELQGAIVTPARAVRHEAVELVATDGGDRLYRISGVEP